jgi:alkylation response protein AidB-like acyl-CoA dehydrogenase
MTEVELEGGSAAPSDDDLAEMVREIRRFVRDEVVPLETEIDERDEMPERIRTQAKELGLYGFSIPARYGGIGLTMTQEVELAFELGWTTPAFRSMFGTNNGIAGEVLMLSGTPEQKQHWLPRLSSGEVTAAFALTEPDAGSSPADLVTTARRADDGEDWVIDGTKRYITNAPLAELFMVFARSSRHSRPHDGISAFCVPAHFPGLTVAPRDHKMVVRETARAYDAGTDTRLGPACAKLFASEMVGRVADRAVQIHGGAGYIRGVPVERFYRDARLFRIYEGTTQIQQLVIAGELLRARR